MLEGGAFGRKYIGTVLEINGFCYFAPLSSFKSKHKKMNESVDFVKIKDYAVVNINNMIPVPEEQLIELDINAEKDPHYKFLLQAESREINRQKDRIRKNAENVYIILLYCLYPAQQSTVIIISTIKRIT